MSIFNSVFRRVCFGLVCIASALQASNVVEQPAVQLFRHPIVYNGEPVWYLVGPNNQTLKKRAQMASKKLGRIIDNALTYEGEYFPKIASSKEGSGLVIRIMDEQIIKLSERDAHLQGFSGLEELGQAIVETLSKQVKSSISLFQLRKGLWGMVISLLTTLLAFFCLKRARSLFSRVERALIHENSVQEEKRSVTLPILGETCRQKLLLRTLSFSRLCVKIVILTLALAFMAAQFFNLPKK